MENKQVKLTKTLLYSGDEGAVTIDVIIDYDNETMWATQKTISELFKKKVNTINEHLKSIFETGELNEKSTIRNFRIVQNESNGMLKEILNFIILML